MSIITTQRRGLLGALLAAPAVAAVPAIPSQPASASPALPASARTDLPSIKDAADRLVAALEARHGAPYRVTVDDESGFVLIMQKGGAR